MSTRDNPMTPRRMKRRRQQAIVQQQIRTVARLLLAQMPHTAGWVRWRDALRELLTRAEALQEGPHA